VILEAMKMEFVIQAPDAGVVKKVLIKEGTNLEPGTQLVEFSAANKKESA